jgi:hypothetical protein
MTDKEAFEFVKSVTLTIGVMGVCILLLVLIGTPKVEPEKKFVTVDKYGECNVVRYTDETQRWHYFLDCRKGG